MLKLVHEERREPPILIDHNGGSVCEPEEFVNLVFLPDCVRQLLPSISDCLSWSPEWICDADGVSVIPAGKVRPAPLLICGAGRLECGEYGRSQILACERITTSIFSDSDIVAQKETEPERKFSLRL